MKTSIKKFEPLLLKPFPWCISCSSLYLAYWRFLKDILHRKTSRLADFLQKQFFQEGPRYALVYFPFLLLLYLFGAQSSSHISVPRQVSLVASTASPKGTVSWEKRKENKTTSVLKWNGRIYLIKIRKLPTNLKKPELNTHCTYKQLRQI